MEFSRRTNERQPTFAGTVAPANIHHPEFREPREHSLMSIARTADAMNNLMRTVMGGLFIGAIGYGGGWLYSNFNPDVRLQQKEQILICFMRDAW